MPVERINQFLEFTDLGGTPSLGIESEKLSECVAELRRRGWLGAFGCPGFGFREANLDFLSQLPELEKVWFWDVALKNIDGLYFLTGLKYFCVHPDRPGIDFSKFLGLETMIWSHNKHDLHVGNLPKLRKLNVWHFKPRSKSFLDLAVPPSVESLELFWANPESLAGMTPLPNLRKLGIHRCRNLRSLTQLAEIAPSLETLIVTTSSKVDSGSIPLNLNTLQTVVVDGKRFKG